MTELRFSLAVAGLDEPLLDAWVIDDRGRPQVRALQQPVVLEALADPQRLPDRDLARQYGSMFARWLHPLLPTAGVRRITFRPLDDVAAELPFETLVSPAGDGRPIFADGVSLIRLPRQLVDALVPPAPLAGSEPGRHVVRALAAPAADLDLPEFVKVVDALAGSRTLRRTIVASPDTRFSGEFDDEHVDLLVCCGHGTRDQGWLLGQRTLSAGALARALRGRPSAMVLAMCQSAATADRLVRSGIALSVGFQGRDSPEIDVRNFVGAALAELREPLLRGGDMFAAWENALREGRRSMSHAEGVLPVAVAHPDLLAGMRARRVTRLESGDQPRRAAVARPFYVPGQVCCWTEEGRTLRLPVTVDAGAQVRVRLTVDGRRDAPELADAWGLPSSWGLIVECKRPPEVEGWATRSAELSAAIRALTHLLDEPPPDAVLALLDAAVARDWGAHDDAPRAIEHATGARVARFTAWPALVAEPTVQLSLDDVALKRRAPHPLAGTAAADVEASLQDAKSLLRLVDSYQLSVIERVPLELRAGRRHHEVYVPAVAALTQADRDGGPILLAVDRASADAEDELRLR